jgi:hypothetical protein
LLKIHSRLAAGAALLSLTVTALGAQVEKTLDLRTRQDKTSFYVILASRGGSATGHAFVVWGVEDGVRHHTTVRALGLYPEGNGANCSSLLRTVPGTVLDEMQTHSFQGITQQLIVRVDAADYQRSWQVARQWDCRHEFSLFSRDCVQFPRAIGMSLQLDMPRRGMTRWTPQAYVRALLAGVTEGTIALEGAVYEGSLMNDQPMGPGVLIYADRSRVEAVFQGPDRDVVTARIPAPAEVASGRE